MHVLCRLDRDVEDCAKEGGLETGSSLSTGFESSRILSHFPGRNSGAVVEKKMSCFEVIKFRFGMAIVCTRFPLIINRISIVSSVKAITYGKAQAGNFYNRFHKIHPRLSKDNKFNKRINIIFYLLLQEQSSS